MFAEYAWLTRKAGEILGPPWARLKARRNRFLNKHLTLEDGFSEALLEDSFNKWRAQDKNRKWVLTWIIGIVLSAFLGAFFSWLFFS